jgi:hypothetical protein
MGKAIRASLLVLLLACSAQAGYMPNDTPAPPPPPTTSTAQAGYMPTGLPEPPTDGGWMGNEAAASLTQSALDLLAALPSLF